MSIINFLTYFISGKHRSCAVPLLTASACWVVCESFSQQATLWSISTAIILKIHIHGAPFP